MGIFLTILSIPSFPKIFVLILVFTNPGATQFARIHMTLILQQVLLLVHPMQIYSQNMKLCILEFLLIFPNMEDILTILPQLFLFICGITVFTYFIRSMYIDLLNFLKLIILYCFKFRNFINTCIIN